MAGGSKGESGSHTGRSGSDLDKLVDRCLHDQAFCLKLQNDPEAALKELNIWTQHREDVIRQKLADTYPGLQAVAGAFGTGKNFAN